MAKELALDVAESTVQPLLLSFHALPQAAYQIARPPEWRASRRVFNVGSQEERTILQATHMQIVDRYDIHYQNCKFSSHVFLS